MKTETIRELRERLQGPRRPYDTHYGRHVMRACSIYLTVLFSKTPLGPAAVTFLSILVGLIGAFFIYRNHWLMGVFFVNGWYLLDHVDGELARYRGISSPTGFYFDTIGNSIVPFFMFLSIGAWLSNGFTEPYWFLVGVGSGYGSLMVLLLAYCENTVVFQCLTQGKSNWLARPAEFEKTAPAPASFLKKIFSAIHFFVTVPVFLPLLSATAIVCSFFDESLLRASFKLLLAGYTILVSIVWTVTLIHRVLSRKLDKTVRALSK